MISRKTNSADALPMVASVSTKVTITDPNKTIRDGLAAMQDGTTRLGMGVQRAAAGVLALLSQITNGVRGWTFDADELTRTVDTETLADWFAARVAGVKGDEVSSAMYSAMRAEFVGTDPRGKKTGDDVTVFDAKTDKAAGNYIARSQHFLAACEMAAALNSLKYTTAHFTPAGFRVKRGHIAPYALINEKLFLMTPIVGKTEDQIVLSNTMSTTFEANTPTGGKARKTERHSASAFLKHAKGASSRGKVKGMAIDVLADKLTKKLSATTPYSAKTMAKLMLLSAALANVLNATAKTDKAKATKKGKAKAKAAKVAPVIIETDGKGNIAA